MDGVKYFLTVYSFVILCNTDDKGKQCNEITSRLLKFRNHNGHLYTEGMVLRVLKAFYTAHQVDDSYICAINEENPTMTQKFLRWRNGCC